MRILVPAVLGMVVSAVGFLGGAAGAEPWRSGLDGQTVVTIEKRNRADHRPSPCADCGLRGAEALEALPADVLSRVGGNAVEYESFLVTHLPEPAARGLAEAARSRGLAVGLGGDRQIRLPWHSFEPGKPAGRNDPRVVRDVPADAVPGLYLVQFAYPIRQEWLAELEACGVQPIAYFQSQTFLVRAAAQDKATRCRKVERYLAWSDDFRASDRLAAGLLDQPSPLGYMLQYVYGTDLTAKSLELATLGATVESRWEPAQDRVAYLHVQAPPDLLRQIAATDPDLLSAYAASDAAPSDERQGNIVAGLHTGSALCGPVGTPSCPHYRDWLQGRGLLTNSNQQIVAIMDTGYDDGGGPTTAIDHHPDLESPERLEGINSTNATLFDRAGHGTMVAGIIAGEGSATIFNTTGLADSNGFYYSSGIAPKSQIYSYRVEDFLNATDLQRGLNHSRARGDGSNRALIINQSWNENLRDQTYYVPDSRYTGLAQFFDYRVRDASVPVVINGEASGLAGDQPATIVFSAGNFAYHCGSGAVGWDSVSSPAVAKNVISVGATESDRPSAGSNPPLACRGCFDNNIPNGRPPDIDATHVGRVASFSGRGRFFGAYPNSATVSSTRVKPDLVAPGVRVFSTVPYGTGISYASQSVVVGCAKYYPQGTYETYGSGTSFAAPVVSGMAAIKRKWFLDRNINPAPSLLKASLIATADSLGGTGLPGHDHRPSPLSGWGRANLNRLTDSRSRQFVNASSLNSVATGQSLVYTFKAADTANPVFIVLVWDDPPSSVAGNSQVPLNNDLLLTVSDGLWRGNMFNENMSGADDGYSYRFNVGIPANDGINNVEAVFIPPWTLSAGQILTVRVTGVNVTQGDSAGRQPFSVYAYNVTN